MGRNGKNIPVFPRVVKLISENYGKTVPAKDLLLGGTFDRGAATSYLYKFIKLGIIEPVESSILKQNTHFKVVKELVPYYTSSMLKHDLKLIEL